MIQAVIPLYINHPSLYPIVTEFFESMKLYPEIELIVIDDNSPLPHDFYVTHRNETNLGFTGSVNKGFSIFNGDVVLVLNDDLKIKKGDLDELISIKDKGIYFTRDTASGNLEQFGAIWAMTRETFEELGYLDETLPHYGSDREYYDRAIHKNIPVVLFSDTCVEHRESATYKHTDLKS